MERALKSCVKKNTVRNFRFFYLTHILQMDSDNKFKHTWN